MTPEVKVLAWLCVIVWVPLFVFLIAPAVLNRLGRATDGVDFDEHVERALRIVS